MNLVQIFYRRRYKIWIQCDYCLLLVFLTKFFSTYFNEIRGTASCYATRINQGKRSTKIEVSKIVFFGLIPLLILFFFFFFSPFFLSFHIFFCIHRLLQIHTLSIIESYPALQRFTENSPNIAEWSTQSILINILWVKLFLGIMNLVLVFLVTH